MRGYLRAPGNLERVAGSYYTTLSSDCWQPFAERRRTREAAERLALIASAVRGDRALYRNRSNIGNATEEPIVVEAICIVRIGGRWLLWQQTEMK
jgi:hypothetical protein